MPTQERSPQRVIGRYAVYDEIASGGMATVHIGRLMSTGGFSRTVAIKRLHPNLTKDPEFVAMFLDEARIAARIRHPCVIQTLDVVALEGELFLVMDYVQGEALAALLRMARRVKGRVPIAIATHIVCDALHGLHAAHEAKNERGEPLNIVHRDVSPQNILVGVDGTARVFDFGIAKAMGRLHSTREGQVKGKLGYMAPEHFQGAAVTRRSDVFAVSIVLWEAVTSERLFAGANEAEVVYMALQGEIPRPSVHTKEVSPALEQVIMRGLERDPSKRFATAHEMALALEKASEVVSARHVGEWVETVAGSTLATRAQQIEAIESARTDPNLLESLRAKSEERRSKTTVRPPPKMAAPNADESESSDSAAAAVPSSPTASDPELVIVPKRRGVVLGAVALFMTIVAAVLFLGARSAVGPAPAAAVPSSGVTATVTATATTVEPGASANAAAAGTAAVSAEPSSTVAASASAAVAPVRASHTPRAGVPRGAVARPRKKSANQLLGRD